MDVVYPYFKALHIVFAMVWFAGLFCMMQLLLQHRRSGDPAGKGGVTESLQHLMRRTWYFIAWPSAVLSFFFGSAIMHRWLHAPWFQLKVALVLLLYVCHFLCHRRYKQWQKGSSEKMQGLRVLSECINLLLFCIVSVAVLRNLEKLFFLLSAVFSLAMLVVFIVRLYRIKKST